MVAIVIIGSATQRCGGRGPDAVRGARVATGDPGQPTTPQSKGVLTCREPKHPARVSVRPTLGGEPDEALDGPPDIARDLGERLLDGKQLGQGQSSVDPQRAKDGAREQAEAAQNAVERGRIFALGGAIACCN
jgi:hypothetical protein